MSKSEISTFKRWSFILGALAFITILSGTDTIVLIGSIISSILLAVGLAGLRARYGESAGGFGRNILLAGLIGSVLFYFALAAGALLGAAGILTEAQVDKGLWILMFGGPAIGLLALTLFGVDALRTKPMPHLNWLPIVAGVWYPASYIISVVYLFTHNGELPWQYLPVDRVVFTIQFIALFAFGAMLVMDKPREMAAA